MNNARKNVKQRLRNREPVFGAWTSLYHPSIVEIFCRSGVDFIGIDIEHSTISLEQSINIMTACQGANVACLPRLASHDAVAIKRLLDSGADGIIVPTVANAAEVANLIRWSKFAPTGKRSFGIARGQGYGFDFAEYVETWNDSSTLIIQIESVEGVENIDEMLAFDEVDGAMIGPYDLSGSLGVPGEIEHPKLKAAGKRVMEACERYGKACGTHLPNPGAENVQAALTDGYTFVILSSDIFLLWQWSERMSGVLQQVR